ncbi:hypothetical protein [Reyranella sp.]|uniref:hypothetical protein n=1 Tax=Reyranella sp. TaxID=1929291 RepID=UPI003C7B1900
MPASSAITKNIKAQYNISRSFRALAGVVQATSERERRFRRATLRVEAALDLHTLNAGEEMQPEVTPTEARSGVVTGRVLMVLIISFIGAVGGMGLAWYMLS